MFSRLFRSAPQFTKPNTDFWRGKRVFVTGHTGFIGGWLYRWLADMGADLAGYSLAPDSNPNFYGLNNLGQFGRHYIDDIRHSEKLNKAMADFDPQIILHLAAQALVRPAFKDPIGTFTTNINGTINVLESARGCKNLQAALIFTTDKVYENTELHVGYAENAPLGGYEPYGASKACAEIVTSAYWHSYFKNSSIPMGTLRAGNVIGGGDWSVDRLIPDAVRAFTTGQDLILRHPESVRPWQHVLEPCHAILRMVETICAPGNSGLLNLNIGPNDKECQTVGWVADRFVAAWNQHAKTQARWKHVPDNKIYEATLLMLDNSLARKILGWSPRWNTATAVQKTAAWYADFYKGGDAAALTLNHISEFMNGDQNV